VLKWASLEITWEEQKTMNNSCSHLTYCAAGKATQTRRGSYSKGEDDG